MDDKIQLGDSWLEKLVVQTARVARLIGPWGKAVVRNVRGRAALTLMRRYHCDVLHRMRLLSFPYLKDDKAGIGKTAWEVATECRILMGDLLELEDHQLHCCLKMLHPGDGADRDLVETWVRSSPHDERPVSNDRHLVQENSVWCALLGGRSDGKFRWPRLRAFACNDFGAVGGRFVCSRPQFLHFYRSAVAP